MRPTVERNFILQQGFAEPSGSTCSRQFGALQLQPRLVLLWIVIGVLLQSPTVFMALCAVLWWSALLPRLNPFDVLYNRVVGSQEFHLTPAPPPRRTAQTMAGAFALICALLLHYDAVVLAYLVEGLFLAAVLALTLGGFCLGSFVYHLARGQWTFARGTLPWAK